MFRATLFPSSWENTVPMRHLVFVILYRWLSGKQGAWRPAYRTRNEHTKRTGRPSLWARTACSFRSALAATLLEFMYHSRIVLSVGGSVWYMIRNLRCTVTIDSVLANPKTQNAFLFTVNAILLHNYPLAVEHGSTPRPLAQKKLGEILYLLICSFLPCLSWLLRGRVRKSRRDLWITLYIWAMNIFTESPCDDNQQAAFVW